MEQLKQAKGITLIALVITIIVLLILAGITINLTIGQDGILKRAQEAGKNYTNAAKYENKQLAELTNTADQIIANVTGGNGVTTPTPVSLSSKAKPGDYVKYDGGNGYKGLWRVLYNDSTYGLQIISDESVDDFTYGSTSGNDPVEFWEDAVNILNNFCAKYVNKSYAKSGRSVGSNPLEPQDNVEGNIVIDITEEPSEENGWTEIRYSVTLPYRKEYMDFTDYYALKNIGILGKNYFLAGHFPVCESTYDNVTFYFKIGCISWAGDYDDTEICFSYNRNTKAVSKMSGTLGVKPVITLIPNIQTISGDGSSELPFELVAQQK